MSKVVWNSPSPSSSYLRGVDVQVRPRRELALLFEFENESGKLQKGELIFSGVVSYRSTFLYAIRAAAFREAYDRVVDMGVTEYLHDTMDAMQMNGRLFDVIHYMVCFDDGPCFDVIAESFRYNTIT